MRRWLRRDGLWLALAAATLWFAMPGSGSEDGEGGEDGEEKTFEADSGPDAIDVSEYPEEMQTLYRLYAKKCSKCHTLARSINSEYRGSDWKRYVARMSRKPNSGISPGTGEKILTFLEFHFGRVDAAD